MGFAETCSCLVASILIAAGIVRITERYRYDPEGELPPMRASSHEILAEIRANQARLDGCVGPHHFLEPEPGERWMTRPWVCALCGGRADGTDVLWYREGVAHGRAAAKEDVKVS
jgi:hypothetical protein